MTKRLDEYDNKFYMITLSPRNHKNHTYPPSPSMPACTKRFGEGRGEGGGGGGLFDLSPHLNPPPQETVLECHCEGVKRPKQSHNALKVKRLPRSLRSLAMTKKGLRHSLQGGRMFCGYLQHNKILASTSILILLLVAILLGSSPQVHAVSKSMEDPLFWISKIKNPNRLLLTRSEIEKMNEESLKKQDLLLCRVKDMKEEWTGEEILAFLKEDWEGFGKTGEIRFGRNGRPLGDSFWNGLREKMNLDALKARNQLLYAMTVKRTDIRVFPTDEVSMSAPADQEFDRFQHSAIAPASPVGIYHFSRDNLWAYVQTSFIHGWIRARDLAIADNRSEAVIEERGKEPLVITGNFVTVFADPLFQQPVFSVQMGTTLPILLFPGKIKTSNHPLENNRKISSPLRPRSALRGGLVASGSEEPLARRGEGQGEGETDHGHPHLNPPPSRGRIIVGKFSSPEGGHSAIGNCYVVKIPSREGDGRLSFRNGYISANDHVHIGFLPYTQKNLAQQAFKMLHQPYGWGEMSGGRDCSRFIMDLFDTFGILMPRNSNLQARMGISLGPLEGKTIEEKKKILDRVVPLATLLRMPGHIMLYLGKHNGVHYAIHSIWGIQKGGKSGPVYQKIGKVAVTDLNLGKEGPNGSLLQRLTEIQLIGPDSEVKK